ncbi:MBL fold metallo-hydrolase [Shewanella submarina]|uniref:MBL fold metallo-hydrolase n=1 Tax=Shewanella submarina TaxID=2016376 RepID=A0ABV7GFD9_9GAMM|nr:MBL fold metallo-hydrolase [Shewanella submarina]MCL1035833.1 MBL fold metallo-hydrolase [Shewanella submarina]
MKVKGMLAVAITLFASGYSQAQEPVWDGNKVVLVSEKLSDGVFAYYPSDAKALESKGAPVATSGGFIVGDKGVLVIDTMLNKRLNAQVQKLISQATDKPLLYAVNTSFHGDHSYGNMYLPPETKIIQHQKTQDYITSHFKADTEFMISNFGQGRGIEEIVPVAADILVGNGGNIMLELGGRTVEIIDFGFAQTGGDLFIWEPEAKVMWTGNPIITVKPSLPWLLDGHLLETLETLEAVYAFLPEDARIVPGHGSVMGREDIKWHIDYLDAIKTQVQAAIDDGLTLEETVKRVTLPEFSGYALYGWVHPALNVPAAYKDLKKD